MIKESDEMKAKVFYTKNIDKNSLVKIYDALNTELKGNVAIKISTGEPGGHNFLDPMLIKDLVQKLNGTIVECNTAYQGKRYNSEDHWQAIKDHGFMDIAKCDIMDEEGEMELEIPNGLVIKKNYVGKNIEKYNSCLVLSHFKGHPMGGYGGALKQLSIGFASSNGKSYIHSAGKVKSQDVLWDNIASQDKFLESMADAASSIINYFKDNIIYINIMKNISVDCDCCSVAEDPCIPDIGILASTDPVALDKACLDLVYNSKFMGKDHFIERVESRHGKHILESASKLNLGNLEYELVDIDN